jgi:hypothetical protein
MKAKGNKSGAKVGFGTVDPNALPLTQVLLTLQNSKNDTLSEQ